MAHNEEGYFRKDQLNLCAPVLGLEGRPSSPIRSAKRGVGVVRIAEGPNIDHKGPSSIVY